ncbi:flagellar export chaperone FlgN [Arthrobacter sp. ok362]|uniref:flagellar export chaperone FlgN n=1 Tax=Arthrobacter sp. ok362 TaxID=1761745 RepID=UPI000892172F|nr:flagellar export chaperone FlgN [Arthrobacter sp. ok362]SDL93281.1 FlgN protein [Arthrobacter sp. ok362]
MSASDLSAALWQERRHLELLLFRLETQRLHIAAGNLEWLNFMASEIETVLDRLRFEALARGVESAAVAAQWGLPAQTTLVELIAAAPAGPWSEILREHLEALHALLARLGEAASVNEEALRTLPLPGRPGPADTAGMLDQLTTGGNLERSLAVVRRSAQPLLAQYMGEDQD